jgi:hypothetical protein
MKLSISIAFWRRVIVIMAHNVKNNARRKKTLRFVQYVFIFVAFKARTAHFETFIEWTCWLSWFIDPTLSDKHVWKFIIQLSVYLLTCLSAERKPFIHVKVVLGDTKSIFRYYIKTKHRMREKVLFNMSFEWKKIPEIT